jgi:ElaB/YqjD/DUF883 family membrane-anchored ribosome-binding protein
MGYAADGTDLSKDFLDSANEAAKRLGAAAETSASEAAMSAQEAIAEIKRIMTDLVERTSARASEVMTESGEQAAERFGAVLDDVQTLGKDSLDRLSDAIARRPVATLAAAAGVGLLIGLATRPAGARK